VTDFLLDYFIFLLNWRFYGKFQVVPVHGAVYSFARPPRKRRQKVFSSKDTDMTPQLTKIRAA